ncbi:uncharacterized protein LOC143908076 [Temnothorax americanus]|uniref:uncharacterized protein LOC143908076 n=1 Tax=Temnothorax americanus TaxID=1964332 RepID=UPI0040685B7D
MNPSSSFIDKAELVLVVIPQSPSHLSNNAPPYPVPPNRFRGWMLPPAASSHATPAQKGARDPKNPPRSNAPPSPVFLMGNGPSRGGCVSSASGRSICYYGSSLCQCEGTVTTPALVIVAIFHEPHSSRGNWKRHFPDSFRRSVTDGTYNSPRFDVPSPHNFGAANYRCVIDEAPNHPEMFARQGQMSPKWLTRDATLCNDVAAARDSHVRPISFLLRQAYP